MKRSLVAVLALSLALGGCGGSDGKKSTASSSTAAAPAPAASSPAPSGGAGAAKGSAVPTAPGGNGTAQAAQKFNDCVRKHGITMPSPHPSSTPSKAELAKIKAALQACVKAMSGTPAATPR
ncbi:hypothetical protein [Actinomadura montaniterrae]|uniref:Uncharacterized protein n=1 Tax=Actinomadura montaniterrae TaxID=1803903 RepID=A0A6L3VP68_9ACTN|nr:hypothetical protein [Actinomadura montaniterrae]KAB2370819.1 hypothetical protein F9B16_34135 [Actinomadura montaniterrae]